MGAAGAAAHPIHEAADDIIAAADIDVIRLWSTSATASLPSAPAAAQPTAFAAQRSTLASRSAAQHTGPAAQSTAEVVLSASVASAQHTAYGAIAVAAAVTAADHLIHQAAVNTGLLLLQARFMPQL